MKTDDIEKAQSSSLKKGIISNRITNPLVPKYKYPGSSDMNWFESRFYINKMINFSISNTIIMWSAKSWNIFYKYWMLN